MLKASLVRFTARLLPGTTRAAIFASSTAMPQAWLSRHWLVNELARELFPDGFPITIGGISLRVYAGAREFYLADYEPMTRRAFKAALRSGARVLDVGANAGYYSLVAAQAVGPSGHVYTVEPSPTNLRLLRANLSSVQNVTLHAVAAGDANGECWFELSQNSLNDAFVRVPYSDFFGITKVRVRRLDDLIEPPIDVIKLDVEGQEPAALLGMERLIRESGHITLFIELGPACLRAAGHDPLDLLSQLDRLGLTVKRVIPHKEYREATLEEVVSTIRREPETKSYWNLIAVK